MVPFEVKPVEIIQEELVVFRVVAGNPDVEFVQPGLIISIRRFCEMMNGLTSVTWL